MPQPAYLPFGIRICVAGLEKGGGEAVKNMPAACFSARGKVPHPGQNPSEAKDSRGVLLCLCLLRCNFYPNSNPFSAVDD
jgi:hypothetical protein